MATVTKKNAQVTRLLGGPPYGNLTALLFNFATNASGIWVDSNQATAVIIGDVLRLGILPKGLKLLDYLNRISTAFTASSTGKVGFQYVDGVDSGAVPQDDDYFCAATTLATAAVLRQTNTAVAPVTLPKDAYLIMTIAGANLAAAGNLDITIFGIADQA
jgi:hypothetical protein